MERANMKAVFLCWVLLFIGLFPLHAQNATPAQPADPNQARPALPVAPVSPTPAPPPANAPAAPPVVVAVIAESSLKLALAEIAQGWADSLGSNPQVPITLTNSGTLRAKVEGGSVWDVVISADVDDMKAMTDKGLLFADNQRSLARNSLVVYGRKALIKDDDLDWNDLLGTEWKKAALGDPDRVASGRVAKRALAKHGLMDDGHKGLYTYAMTDSLILGVAERDQADAVFIYRTDAIRANLSGFDIFPINTDDAPPVFYTAAVSKLSKNPDQARAFIDYCIGDAARPIWAKYGFETN
jgi:molybdate transport system substrate-binding protein